MKDQDIEKKIHRLTKLIGSDPGFYILALHSFIEFYLRQIKQFGPEPTFPQLTWAFRSELLEQYGNTFIDGLSSLGHLGRQHAVTNQVRHSFIEISGEEARSATQLFIRFCRLAGVTMGEHMDIFYRHLDVWKKKESYLEQDIIIRSLQSELAGLQKENNELMQRIDTFRKLKERYREVSLELEQKNRIYEEARRGSDLRDEKIDTLRRERRLLREEKNALLKEREDYRQLETYLDYLGRMTVYTRSRIDFERVIAEVTPEQDEIAGSITFNKDWLIRGRAGTGKSLVLLEIMRRAARQGTFDFVQDRPLLFVTFTKTLVKYSRYTAALMNFELPDIHYSTADTVIFESLKNIEEDFEYDFFVPDRFLEQAGIPDFMTQEEVKAELEDFILGRLVTRDEYLENMLPREGMRRPLNFVQREQLWRLFEDYVGYMEEKRRFSVHYGRYKLSGFLKANREDRRLPTYRTIFIDEVQDLNPAGLSALKGLTGGALIMAGDFDQSLYVLQHPFSRAGIDIRGNTRVLKTNFRNTRQISSLAERFRRCSPGASEGSDMNTFRDGPEPELFVKKRPEELEDTLYRRIVLFISDMGYDPENICVLTYHNRDIEQLMEFLAGHGIDNVKVNTDGFDFVRNGVLNLSTLHSCKGIDFPVVMLYLPDVVRLKSFKAEDSERLLRNLIYVGLTRAMDHLDVFILESADRVVQDLSGCF